MRQTGVITAIIGPDLIDGRIFISNFVDDEEEIIQDLELIIEGVHRR